MNRAGIALVLAGVLNSGCLPTNFVLPATSVDTKGAAPDKKAGGADAAVRKPRSPVTAGQVTAANAREKAQELRDEIENDLLSHIETQEK